MKKIVFACFIAVAFAGFGACSNTTESSEKTALEQDMKVGDSTLETEHKLIEDAQAKMEADHKSFVARHAQLKEAANSPHNMIEEQHQKLLNDHKAVLDKHQALVERHQALEKQHEEGKSPISQISADHSQMMKDHAQLMGDHARIQADFDKMMREDDLIKEQDSSKLSHIK